MDAHAIFPSLGGVASEARRGGLKYSDFKRPPFLNPAPTPGECAVAQYRRKKKRQRSAALYIGPPRPYGAPLQRKGIFKVHFS